jgi:hypothetical protein
MNIFHKPLAELTLLDLGKVAAWIIGILVLLGIVAVVVDAWLEELKRPKSQPLPPTSKTGVWKIRESIERWFMRVIYAIGAILLVGMILGWILSLFGKASTNG